MRIFSALLATAAVVAGIVALPLVATAQDAIVITTDNTTYIDGYGADPFVHITVSGLEACAGETVEAVLFAASGPSSVGDPPVPFAGRVVSVDVPESGAFVADVRTLWEQFGTVVYPGVRGDCVPGGYAVGDGITFLHNDPPFGPVLPPAPLPDGVTIDVSQVDDITFGVGVSGFPACAGRNLAVSLATETGGSVFPDPNIGVNATETFDDAGSVFAGLKVDGVPAGRYIVWIRSVCTGTWVAPGIVEIAGAPVTPSPPPVAPGPPVVGNGTAAANSGGVSWLFLAAAAVLGAGGSLSVAMAARRR